MWCWLKVVLNWQVVEGPTGWGGCRLWVVGCRLSVIGYRLSVVSCGLSGFCRNGITILFKFEICKLWQNGKKRTI